MNKLTRVLLTTVILSACIALVSCSNDAGTVGSANPAPETKASAAPETAPLPAEAPVADAPERAPAKEPAPRPKKAEPVLTPKAAAPAPVRPAAPAPDVERPAVAEVIPPVVERAPEPLAPPPPPEPPRPTTRQVTIPSGSLITVRTIDAVDSKTDRAGRSFRASLDEAVSMNGQTVIPRGSDVDLKLVEVRRAGEVRGNSELQLQLDRIFVESKPYRVESNIYQTEGSSQGKRTARNAVIGGALGAAIGAITGGGKGAAIGATAGAGGGVAAGIMTKDQVRIESETQLVFRLEGPLEITVPVDGFPER